MPIPRKAKDDRITFRISRQFKGAIEEAAIKAGFPSLTEYVKAALIERMERDGVKVNKAW